jgi:1-acyl-sn-glycerol-3-phosphate acyltransferase
MAESAIVLRGLLTILLFILNLAFWGTLVLVVAPIKFLLPRSELRRRVILLLARFGAGWVGGNNAICDWMLPTVWDVSGIEETGPEKHYLIVSNHVSAVDIIALFRVFHRRMAFLRFFLKHQLVWFPILGQACQALEFPFMKRYSPDYLARHPEKRGRDLETTRRACQRYRDIPVAILNFLEGTRFTLEKQANQESPYRHLLRPRIGGISFVLASLGDQLDALYDVTLAYPGGNASMWDFVTGRVPRIVVHARRLEIPSELTTPEVTEPGPARDRLKEWIDEMWREKDELLRTMSDER